MASDIIAEFIARVNDVPLEGYTFLWIATIVGAACMVAIWYDTREGDDE